MGATRATTYDELRTAISDRYVALPRQLQRVAEVALERPSDLALKTVAALAEDAGVQPSTLVCVVHEIVGREHRRVVRTLDPEGASLPQGRTLLIDDPRRVEDVSDAQSVVQRTCQPE